VIRPGDLDVSHVGLFVVDIDAMERFYCDTLGFVVTDRGKVGEAAVVFLSQSPRDHHQVVLAGGRPADEHFNVVNQLSLRASSLAVLKDLLPALQQAEVAEIETVFHGPTISMYFRDPEGTRVEVFIDTPWYTDQPMRIPVDLTVPDDALWADLEVQARSAPGFTPLEQWQAEFRERIRRGQSA